MTQKPRSFLVAFIQHAKGDTGYRFILARVFGWHSKVTTSCKIIPFFFFLFLEYASGWIWFSKQANDSSWIQRKQGNGVKCGTLRVCVRVNLFECTEMIIHCKLQLANLTYFQKKHAHQVE